MHIPECNHHQFRWIADTDSGIVTTIPAIATPPFFISTINRQISNTPKVFSTHSGDDARNERQECQGGIVDAKRPRGFKAEIGT